MSIPAAPESSRADASPTRAGRGRWFVLGVCFAAGVVVIVALFAGDERQLIDAAVLMSNGWLLR